MYNIEMDREYTMEELENIITNLKITLKEKENTAETLKQSNSDKISGMQEEIDKWKEKADNANKENEEIYKIFNDIIEVKINTIKTQEDIKNTLIKLMTRGKDADYAEKEYAESLRKLEERENKIKELEERSIYDFLPEDPIKVATMLIDAEMEETIFGMKNMCQAFYISELRQIAEHLLVYCKGKECEGEG